MAFSVFGAGDSPRLGRNALAVLVLGVLVLVVFPVALQVFAWSRKGENDDLRDSLQKVQAARNDVRAQSQKKDSVASRYAKKAPPLSGYLEQTARANKLEISDSTDRNDIPHGKRYTERVTNVHLKKAGMLPIARFLEALEQSGHPISLSRLSVRKRSGEPNSYDVELSISAFDRTEVKASPASSSSASGSPSGTKGTP